MIYSQIVTSNCCFISIDNTNAYNNTFATGSIPTTQSSAVGSNSAPSAVNIPLISNSRVVRNYLSAKLHKTPELVTSINDYDVPVFRFDRVDLSTLSFDIAFRHIIFYIDGFSHVKKISKDLNMDIGIVKKAVALLLYYNIIILVNDIFKFSNIYRFNNEYFHSFNIVVYAANRQKPQHFQSLQDALSSMELLQEIKEFACMEYISEGVPSSELPSNLDILLFIMKFQTNKTLQQVLMDCLIEDEECRKSQSQKVGANSVDQGSIDSAANSPMTQEGRKSASPETFALPLKNINIQRLIIIALAKKLIRRVHEYPVYIPLVPPSAPVSSPAISLGPLSRNPSSHGYQNEADPLSTSNHRPDENPQHGNPVIKTPSTTFSSPKEDNSRAQRMLLNQSINNHTPISRRSYTQHLQNINNTSLTTNLISNNIGIIETGPRTIEMRQFSKLTSRSKTVLSKSYLREHVSNFSIVDLIQTLDGTEHLDALCCKYEITATEIINFPGIHIVYK